MSGKEFNIVIVGDSKTGKTTMIQSLIDTNIGEVPAVLANPIRFPPSQSFFGDQGTTMIVDTPSPISSEAIDKIDKAILNAHAVCIVCDMTNPRTIKRAGTYWIPHIRQLRPTTPFMDNDDLPSQKSGWRAPGSPIKPNPANNSISGILSDSEEDIDFKINTGKGVADDDDDDDYDDDDDDEDVIIDDGSCGADNGTFACIPIIIAWNKVDAVKDPDMSEFDALMDRFGEIETCLSCSAFQTLYVSQLFTLIEKAIVFPNAPLYDPANEQFTKRGQCALSRIFSLLDRDCDNRLNDNDLQTIQQLLSGDSPTVAQNGGGDSMGPEDGIQQHIYMTPKQIEGIKERIAEKDPEGIDTNGYVTLSGFFSLNSLWIRKKNIQSTWSLLYAFGYNTWLEISDSVLEPPCPSDALKLQPGCRYELSSRGVNFLRERFMANDRDSTGNLTQDELKHFFRPVPAKALIPWGCGFPERPLSKMLVDASRSRAGGGSGNVIGLEGLLSQFHLLCLLDQPLCLKYLAYLGFGNGISPYPSAWSAFTVVKEPTVPAYHPLARNINSISSNGGQQIPSRNVYMCYVFGSRGSGKTSLLRALVNKPFETNYVPSPENMIACNSVTTFKINGQNKYLCMIEFINDDDTAHNRDFMSRCDVICLAHDVTDPSSFTHVHRLHNQILGSYPWIPCVHAFTKIDKPAVRQLSVKTPDEFFQENMLQGPCKVSLRDQTTVLKLFETLVMAAESPTTYLPKKAPLKKGWSLFGFWRSKKKSEPHVVPVARAAGSGNGSGSVVSTGTKMVRGVCAMTVITLSTLAIFRWKKVIKKKLLKFPIISWVWKLFPL